MSLLNIINESRKNGGCDLMQDRQLAVTPENVTVKITDFGFINAKNGETLVFVVEDHEDVFYFGNSILKEFFSNLKNDEEAMEEFGEYGLAVTFEEKRQSRKSGREYYPVVFLYEEQKRGEVEYSVYGDEIKERDSEDVPFNKGSKGRKGGKK